MSRNRGGSSQSQSVPAVAEPRVEAVEAPTPEPAGWPADPRPEPARCVLCTDEIVGLIEPGLCAACRTHRANLISGARVLATHGSATAGALAAAQLTAAAEATAAVVAINAAVASAR